MRWIEDTYGLLDAVIEAHGGEARWRSAREIVAEARAGGPLLAAKFRGWRLRRFSLRVDPRRPKTVISSFPHVTRRGVFEGDRVWIENDAGRVLSERTDPRAHFGFFPHTVKWDHLDLLYFVGYAFWSYLCIPFVLLEPDLDVNEIEPWRENGQVWRRLRVRFPEAIPTHSPEQTLYFDPKGLLRRLDYTAEVAGSWAVAAHYCVQHRDFEGIVVATERRVYPRRASGRRWPVPIMRFILDDFELVGE